MSHSTTGGESDVRRAPPFFVVGADRSGTTLIRVVLDRHPDICVPPESHFIPWMYARRQRYGSEDRVEDVERFLHDLSSHPRFQAWGVSVDNVRTRLRSRSRPTFADAIDDVFTSYAELEGKLRWGDKTPRYVRALPVLSSLFPEARFIHVIRDGRDAALSVLDLHRLHDHPATAGFLWARQVQAGQRGAASLPLGRYLEVRYEDAVADPSSAFRRICEHIGAPFTPAMLEHDVRSLEKVPESKRARHSRIAQPITSGLRDWRVQMDRREVEEFEAVAGRQLDRLGYERSSVSLSPGIRARAWSRVLVFGATSAFPRLRVRWRRLTRTRAGDQGLPNQTT